MHSQSAGDPTEISATPWGGSGVAPRLSAEPCAVPRCSPQHEVLPSVPRERVELPSLGKLSTRWRVMAATGKQAAKKTKDLQESKLSAAEESMTY